MKIARNPKNVHLPVAPYVHQIEISNPMRWLTISGQLGMCVDGNVPESALEQMGLAFQNIENNLVAANMEIKDITKLVFYLVENIDTEARKKVTRDFLGDHLPCTTMVYVVALAAPRCKVEIDAWACKEE